MAEDPIAALYAKGVLGAGGVDVEVGCGVATVVLNDPKRANCLHARMTEGLRGVVNVLAGTGWGESIRVVLLKGKGKTFCSGADARAMVGKGPDAVRAQSADFAALLADLAALPQLVVGVANGGAFGGGVGLLMCCDIVVAEATAAFSFSEVKLGMIPATISPYVIDRIGVTRARQLFLTAARLTANEALACGLVDHVLPAADVSPFVGKLVANQTLCAPRAVAMSKQLVADVKHRPFTPALVATTVDHLVAVRGSEEVKHGSQAFLKKQKPRWAAAPLVAKL